MSNRFVSGGVIDSNGEATNRGELADGKPKVNARNTEWEAVQKELEAERKQREEQRIKAASGEEKSLYEILQANKEAKQAAFEEQNKIRNQFRALDDDEINFLDEVRERERKAEEEKKRELEDGLKAFREARKAEGTTSTGDEGNTAEADGLVESWEVSGRKRKRVKGKERDVKGVRRKTDDSEQRHEDDDAQDTAKLVATEEPARAEASQTKTGSATTGGERKVLSLVDYGSDDSDDE